MSNYMANKMDNLEEMDRFLEKFYRPRRNQGKKKKIMNKPIGNNEIKTVIQNFSKNKSPGPRWLHRGILSNI